MKFCEALDLVTQLFNSYFESFAIKSKIQQRFFIEFFERATFLNAYTIQTNFSN